MTHLPYKLQYSSSFIQKKKKTSKKILQPKPSKETAYT